jgi:hypothetical protein
MVDEVLGKDTSCALFLDFEDFNCCTLRFSSDPPDAFADNCVLQEVEELACKVDANVAVPLVRALLLDLGWNLLRAHLFNVKQFTISRAEANDDFWYAAVRSATWRIN